MLVKKALIHGYIASPYARKPSLEQALHELEINYKVHSHLKRPRLSELSLPFAHQLHLMRGGIASSMHTIILDDRKGKASTTKKVVATYTLLPNDPINYFVEPPFPRHTIFVKLKRILPRLPNPFTLPPNPPFDIESLWQNEDVFAYTIPEYWHAGEKT